MNGGCTALPVLPSAWSRSLPAAGALMRAMAE